MDKEVKPVNVRSQRAVDTLRDQGIERAKEGRIIRVDNLII